MVVLITNITDGPGKKPVEVRVYNKKLAPGVAMRVDAKFVDEKVRKLEDAGYIALGPVPVWYADYSAKRQVRNLSAEQVRVQLGRERADKEKREKAKVATAVMLAGGTPKPRAPKPAPSTPHEPKLSASPVVTTEFSDSVEMPTDDVQADLKIDKKRSKKNKNRG